MLRLPDILGFIAHPYYRNPFYKAHVQVGRVDMGVDYHGTGPICAIGKARIEGLGGHGWPGGQYILYKLLRGRHAGRFVYVAEAVHPVVTKDQVVSKGQTICHFTAESAPGASPGIETGWSSPILNETLAAQTEQPLPPNNSNTRAGQAFARFLKRIGAPAPVVPPGAEYPL